MIASRREPAIFIRVLKRSTSAVALILPHTFPHQDLCLVQLRPLIHLVRNWEGLNLHPLHPPHLPPSAGRLVLSLPSDRRTDPIMFLHTEHLSVALCEL